MTQQVRRTGAQWQLPSLQLGPISTRGYRTKKRHFISAERQFKASSLGLNRFSFCPSLLTSFQDHRELHHILLKRIDTLCSKWQGCEKHGVLMNSLHVSGLAFFYPEILPNESPWSCDKGQRHFSGLALHAGLHFYDQFYATCCRFAQLDAK